MPRPPQRPYRPSEASLGPDQARLRLKDLQLLTAIDEHRSISGAAASLGLLQPAASRSLMEIERALRTHLFERDRTLGMQPTASGEVVLAHARAMLADLRLMHARLDARRDGGGMNIRLGVIPFAPTTMLAKLALALVEPPQAMTFTFTEGSSAQLRSALQARILDAAIVRAATSALPDGIQQDILLQQEACLLLHPASPLIRQQRITPADLTHVRWLLPPGDTPTRYFINEAFAGMGLPAPRPILEASSGRIVHWAVQSISDLVAVVPLDVGRELEKLGGVHAMPWNKLSLSKALKFPAIALLYPLQHRGWPHIERMLAQLRRFAVSA